MGFDVLIIFIIVLGALFYYFFSFKPKRDPMNKALAYIKQNRLPDAINEYKRVLYLNPNNSNVHYQIATLYYKLNKYEEAIFHLNEIKRIDKYDYEVEKLDVEKKLAKSYIATSNIADAIQTYVNILNIYPEDVEALYHVSFSILGQEEFDIAQKFFSRLIKFKDSFEIYFGIGICHYQNKKFSDAINTVKEALSLKPESDIANLAAAFALMRDENYKEAITYARKLINASGNENVKFISMRMLAILLILTGKENESVAIMEKILEKARSGAMEEELKFTLYDLGFACVKAGKPNKAQAYWKELAQKEGDYKNIVVMLNLLDKELNPQARETNDDFELYAADNTDEWLANIFPPDFLWEICGLKSEKKLDIKNMLVTTRVAQGKGEAVSEIPAESYDYTDRLEKFCTLNSENFRVLSNRLVSKMGYKVDEILQTYRDADGVDFLAKSGGQKILIWVRRWKDAKINEIPLRNFAQAITDTKVSRGIFITTAELTDPALNALKTLSKVTVVSPSEVNALLRGLVQL